MNDHVFMQGTNQNSERYLELITLAAFSSALKCLKKSLHAKRFASTLPYLDFQPILAGKVSKNNSVHGSAREVVDPESKSRTGSRFNLQRPTPSFPLLSVTPHFLKSQNSTTIKGMDGQSMSLREYFRLKM